MANSLEQAIGAADDKRSAQAMLRDLTEEDVIRTEQAKAVVGDYVANLRQAIDRLRRACSG